MMNKTVKAVLSYLAFWLMWLLGMLIFKIGNHVKVSGRENIPRGRRILYYSNHQTLIDSILVGISLLKTWQLFFNQGAIIRSAPDEKNFFGTKFGRFLMDLLGSIPVKRNPKKIDQIDQQVNKFCQVLEKNNLHIFFEGTRTRNGEVGDCRYGAAKTVLKARPNYVVPITLIGIGQIMPLKVGFKYHHLKFGKHGQLIIGKPIDFSDIYDVSEEIMSEKEKIKLIGDRIKNAVLANVPKKAV